MFKIPDEFREIPEAVKVREAEVCFEAAIELEKRATQPHSNKPGPEPDRNAYQSGGANRHGEGESGAPERPDRSMKP